MEVVVKRRGRSSGPRVEDIRTRVNGGQRNHVPSHGRGHVALRVGLRLTSVDVALGDRRRGGQRVVAKTSRTERRVAFSGRRPPVEDVYRCVGNGSKGGRTVRDRKSRAERPGVGVRARLERKTCGPCVGVIQRELHERRHGGTGHVACRVVGGCRNTVVDAQVVELLDGVGALNCYRTGIDVGVVVKPGVRVGAATGAVDVGGQRSSHDAFGV